MNQVLFICTGNYYRSRYAEIVFNHTASQYGLDWNSFSRGFRESTREAPISHHASNALMDKNIFLDQVRYPKQLSPSDLALAHRIILMDDQEHRPMMNSEYPEWFDHVEFWNIQDIDFETPNSALGRLDSKIDLLIGSLEAESNQFYWNNNHLNARVS